jgi:hypothetical protein
VQVYHISPVWMNCHSSKQLCLPTAIVKFLCQPIHFLLETILSPCSKVIIILGTTYQLTFWHRSFTFNSNKSPTWCNNFSVYYPDVCLQLNMFRAFSRPSLGAQWLQWQPLVLPSYRGDSRAVVRGRAGRTAGPTTNTARLSSLQYEGKTRGCHCSHWAPDDGRKNARNMLSCKQTSG